jgi:hypothetical protein
VDFLVEPGAAATIAEVPRELAPARDAVLIADAATSLAAHPEARAWHVTAQDLSLEGPTGRAWQPRATLECDEAQGTVSRTFPGPDAAEGSRPGLHGSAERVHEVTSSAVVRIHAETPLIDAALVAVGNWRVIDPMVMTLAAGESVAARVEWRGPLGAGHCVELHCAGRRIATA